MRFTGVRIVNFLQHYLSFLIKTQQEEHPSTKKVYLMVLYCFLGSLWIAVCVVLWLVVSYGLKFELLWVRLVYGFDIGMIWRRSEKDDEIILLDLWLEKISGKASISGITWRSNKLKSFLFKFFDQVDGWSVKRITTRTDLTLIYSLGTPDEARQLLRQNGCDVKELT